MKRKNRRYVPLSSLLENDWLGDLAKYADIIIDIRKTETKETEIEKKPFLVKFWS